MKSVGGKYQYWSKIYVFFHLLRNPNLCFPILIFPMTLVHFHFLIPFFSLIFHCLLMGTLNINRWLIKMRSQLAARFMPFSSAHSAYILTFCDKKYSILTFRDKTELYLTVLQQNNTEAC